MESVLDELWDKYAEEEEEEETGRENGATEQALQRTMSDEPEPKENSEKEELEIIRGDVEKLHIQRNTKELSDGEEEWNLSPEGKETEKIAGIENVKTETINGGEETLHRTNDETNVTSPLEKDRQFGGSGSPTHPQLIHSSTASTNTNTIEHTDNTAVDEATTHPQHIHQSPATLDNCTAEQPDKEINANTPAKEAPTHHVRKKSSVEGGRAYVDYLKLEGVEVILLSPSRLNDTSWLSEVSSNSDFPFFFFYRI